MHHCELLHIAARDPCATMRPLPRSHWTLGEDMDPRTWVDQLFTYGPYAVLALFVLWVAPAQLKAFRQGARGSPTQQAVSGFVTIGCWLIVFAMVYYIYLFWPPRTVYLGSLGTHPASAQFF